jgi:regulator of replication initiation timing
MPAVIGTFLVWVGTEAAKAGVKAIAGAAVSKLADAGVDAVLGIEIQGVIVEQWAERGKMIVLGSFTGTVGGASFETQVRKSFEELQTQVNGLKQDITDLQKEMTDLKWQVINQFDKADEEKLWKSLLALDNTLNSLYSRIGDVVKSTKSLEERHKMALDLSRNIILTLDAEVKNMSDWFHGGAVEDVNLRGFLDIWQAQALRGADKGWDGERLASIYGLLEAKFTRALLIQVKCVRLLMEAYEAVHLDDPAQQSGVDYFVDTFYPLLQKEVEGFRELIESLAINLIPLPTGTLLPLKVPDDIAGMLARLDMFSAQALMGKKVSGGQTPVTTGRNLPTVPALTGVWGRVLVPATRWIRRKAGTKEEARVTFIKQGVGIGTFNGILEVRAVKYLPYENDKKVMLHQGYQIQVGNELRDMDEMLVAHFTPSDVLPKDMPQGEVDVKLETRSGELLAQTQAFVVPAPLDEQGKAFAPYGTFMMSFTGGAGIRAR